MDVNKLVRMANQIAANFDTGHGPEKAVAGVADHLRRFWGSPMKREIVEYHRSGQPGLTPLAEAAVAELAAEINDAA